MGLDPERGNGLFGTDVVQIVDRALETGDLGGVGLLRGNKVDRQGHQAQADSDDGKKTKSKKGYATH